MLNVEFRPAVAGDFSPQLRDALTREFWIGATRRF